MNILTFDVETTHRSKPNGGYTPLPYFGNQLVSVGYKQNGDTIERDSYLCFFHEEEEPTPNAREIFQDRLDWADVVVGHNLKFDLNWVRSCGFKYDGHIYDTMVAEYVLARARKWPLNLEALSKRYGGVEKQADLTKDYLKEGKTFAQIPWDIVVTYGIADVDATYDIAVRQLERYETTWEELYV